MPGAVAVTATIAAETTLGAVAFGVAVNAGASIGFASAIGALVSGVVLAGANLVLSAVTGAVLGSSRKASAPSIAATVRDRSITIRQPISAHRIVYGEVRVGGVLTFIESTNDASHLHQVVTVAGHEMNTFIEWMVNDEKVTLNASNEVTSGPYKKGGSERITLEWGDGTTGGDAAMRTALEANTTGWTANHKQTGRAKFYANFNHSSEVFISNLPNISALVQGRKVYDPRPATTVYSNNAALCIRDYLVETGFGLGEPVARLNESSFIAAANICEEMVSVEVSRTFTADPVLDRVSLASAAAGVRTGDEVEFTTTGTLPTPLVTGTRYHWIAVDGSTGQLATSKDDALDGTAIDITDAGTGTHTLIRSLNQSFTADAGTDVITLFAKIRGLVTGNGVEVTTDGALPAGLAAATIYYYIRLTDTTGKLATTYANAMAGTGIDITDAGTGTHILQRKSEARYTCNGTFDTDQTPKDILESLLTSCAGRLTYQGGQWNIYVGAYTAPTITLNQDDLDGGFSLDNQIGRRDIFNGVKGVFVSPDDLYQPTDFPAITNATYLAEDNNEKKWKDVELKFTTSSSTAQRLAKIELEKVRRQKKLSLPCKLTALRLQAGDTVGFDYSRFGWTGKVFDIEEWGFAVRGGSDKNAPALGIDLTLRETDANVYAWSSGEEVTLDPAPQPTLPDPFNIAAPTGLTLTSGTAALFIKKDGTVVSRIKVEWTASTGPYVDKYEVQFKKSADSTWQPSLIVPDDTTLVFIWEIEDGQNYDVRVRAVNELGVKSAWAAVTNHTAQGKSALPANVTGFSATQNGGVVTFKWDQVSDADLSGYEIRYMASPLVWADANSLTKVTKGTLVTNAGLPPGTWDLAIKAVDTSGNESAAATTTSIALTNANSIVNSVERSPRWIGTLSNFIKHDVSGRLVPDSQNLANATSDFSVFDNFVVNPQTICTYEAPEIDIGFDATSLRIWADKVAALGPGATGTADPIFQVDYKLNAGAYDGFEDWTVGIVNARQVKAKIKMDTSTGVAYLSSFKPTLDAEPRTETGTGVAVAISGEAIAFASQFNVVPNIQVTAQGSSALFAIISSITVTGFTVKIFNSSGTDVGGTVDWSATGA